MDATARVEPPRTVPATWGEDVSPPARPSGARPSRRALLALALVVLATRLPFLGPGYGLDPDAWRLADAARHIATTGEYAISRVPGYPVVEYGSALLWRGGASALCSASALCCAAAAVLLALLTARLSPRAALPAGVALALTPIIFVSSTSAMDYLWALAPALGGLLAAQRGRPVAAGVLLGLAIGARLTSGVLLAPAAWLLLRGLRGRRGAALACALGLGVGALCFAPVLASHELTTLGPVRGEYPPLRGVLARLGPRSLGAIGAAAALAALALACHRRRAPVAADPGARASRTALQMGAGLTLAVFLALPYETAYLLPFLALALPLLLERLPRQAAWALAGALALASFVEPRGGALAPGPVLRDHAARVEREELRARILATARALDRPAVLVVGPWLPELRYELGSERVERVELEFVLSPRYAELARSWERELLFVDDIVPWHAAVSGRSPAELGARALLGAR